MAEREAAKQSKILSFSCARPTVAEIDLGALVANYGEVCALSLNGSSSSVAIRDVESGRVLQVHARHARARFGDAAVDADGELLGSTGSGDWEVVPTIVEAGASIGAHATIVCGVRIGARAMIGAGSVVTRDVPPGTVVVGNPARVVRTR